MKTWTRGCLAALGLLAAGTQMAAAATSDGRSGRSAGTPALQDHADSSRGLAYAAQAAQLAPHLSPAPAIVALGTLSGIQQGNEFNWLNGGGG